MSLPLEPITPQEFEKVIASLFRQMGFDVIMPAANTQGYDIELKKGDKVSAVQVKKHKAKINIAQLEKFQNFLSTPLADRFNYGVFNYGVFVSESGYAKSVLTHIYAEKPSNLILYQYENDRLIRLYPEPIEPPTPLPSTPPRKYFGVFTCKGGVGKTTTAAHLAGAFALMGHDVILLDLDPEKNLRKLFLNDPNDDEGTASLFVPPVKKGGLGATITVLNHDEWSEQDYSEKIVICDCSPVLEQNPALLIKQLDYCIIPTTLNPLGIAKNSDVITRTFAHIRTLNTKADMFCLINSFHTDEKRNEVLLDHLQKHIDLYAQHDAKCHLIHPDDANIRYSKSLLYWGYHIINGSQPQLAFEETGGRSHPRSDFLQLAGYLEEHTDIEQLRT
jgi:chromosome partitioning protein